ncbi:hypothetical protein LMG3481_05388 [Achromobacter deleyi]|nr:hypothetical protein LMG3481_05388 [Achromobacter deleyi]CAB3928236.1 hypothetical protein LMG3412_06142 [Achromobacter deleyi]
MASGAPAGTGSTGRSTSGSVSTPHRPQPVRPAMARRRDFSRASQALEISTCTTMPSHCGSTSMPRTSATLSMMPSDKEKPTAKSSRSAGVASMVAWLMPLNSSATGVSSAR